MSIKDSTNPTSDVGKLRLGELIEDGRGAKRDAVHIAVIPQVNTTAQALFPSMRVPGGIVDPFLTVPVNPGERYWLWMTPGSVTSLRHAWDHDLFPKDEKEDDYYDECRNCY